MDASWTPGPGVSRLEKYRCRQAFPARPKLTVEFAREKEYISSRTKVGKVGQGVSDCDAIIAQPRSAFTPSARNKAQATGIEVLTASLAEPGLGLNAFLPGAKHV